MTRPRKFSESTRLSPSRPGVTVKTLSSYLRDAHNYPEAMDFELTRQQADALAEYMLTLRERR